jgi:transposase-like protein
VAPLEQRGVGFRSLTESIDTTTPGGRLIFHLFGALGQFERDLIQERTRAGLAAAAARGWKALGELWPTTCEQRCWVHKTANVLNKLPKNQPKAKRSLQEIWMAETSKDAEAALDAFIAAYELKYDKAAECLAKDRQALLAFYDFPAEHSQDRIGDVQQAQGDLAAALTSGSACSRKRRMNSSASSVITLFLL